MAERKPTGRERSASGADEAAELARVRRAKTKLAARVATIDCVVGIGIGRDDEGLHLKVNVARDSAADSIPERIGRVRVCRVVVGDIDVRDGDGR